MGVLDGAFDRLSDFISTTKSKRKFEKHRPLQVSPKLPFHSPFRCSSARIHRPPLSLSLSLDGGDQGEDGLRGLREEGEGFRHRRER